MGSVNIMLEVVLPFLFWAWNVHAAQTRDPPHLKQQAMNIALPSQVPQDAGHVLWAALVNRLGHFIGTCLQAWPGSKGAGVGAALFLELAILYWPGTSTCTNQFKQWITKTSTRSWTHSLPDSDAAPGSCRQHMQEAGFITSNALVSFHSHILINAEMKQLAHSPTQPTGKPQLVSLLSLWSSYT